MNASMGELTISEVGLRLGLSFVVGLVVGWERESHGRAAGLRTTILACVAAAIAMILSQYFFIATIQSQRTWGSDMARLPAGILAGMGFLGAGTIIRQRHLVRGVTTAASLWFVTVLGLAIGSGYHLLGLMGALIVFITLLLLPLAENYVQKDWYGSVTIVLGMNGPSETEVCDRIQGCGMTVKELDLQYDLESRRRSLRCAVKFKRNGRQSDQAQRVVRELAGLPEVVRVHWT